MRGGRSTYAGVEMEEVEVEEVVVVVGGAEWRGQGVESGDYNAKAAQLYSRAACRIAERIQYTVLRTQRGQTASELLQLPQCPHAGPASPPPLRRVATFVITRPGGAPPGRECPLQLIPRNSPIHGAGTGAVVVGSAMQGPGVIRSPPPKPRGGKKKRTVQFYS